MVETTVERYIDIARSTGIFHPEECVVLRELLEDCFAKPDVNYRLIHEEIPQGSGPAGFLLFGQTPMTRSTWDIYWLIVDKKYHGKGLGKKMMQRAEEFILTCTSEALIRVETSTRREYAIACDFYRKRGFIQSGIIPDFYGAGDDLVIFYKKIRTHGI
ncbi:MAG: GNAT family N-acetyltransferase [Candidatus Omnitrophica bacterium]|nr:GNAT family N-acetyltransferase [Candidatus Omnitrophota bacterium]